MVRFRDNVSLFDLKVDKYAIKIWDRYLSLELIDKCFDMDSGDVSKFVTCLFMTISYHNQMFHAIALRHEKNQKKVENFEIVQE